MEPVRTNGGLTGRLGGRRRSEGGGSGLAPNALDSIAVPLVLIDEGERLKPLNTAGDTLMAVLGVAPGDPCDTLAPELGTRGMVNELSVQLPTGRFTFHLRPARGLGETGTLLTVESAGEAGGGQDPRVDVLISGVRAATDGNLAARVQVGGTDTIAELGVELERLLRTMRENIGAISTDGESLRRSSDGLMESSHKMAAAAEQTSTQADVVSRAAGEVSDNVQSVAAGIEELTSSIREIAKNATDAARVATDGVKAAENTNRRISKLGESSVEIGKVIKVITSIAQQTNLLALNATIEAARAGAAGKGFAVVANEVKELAKETAAATTEISTMIETIQGDTNGAVEALAGITTTIREISSIQGTIAAAVEEQTATSNEMSRNIQIVALSSAQIASNIGGVAQAARETSHVALTTQRSADQLRELSRSLGTLVEQFRLT